MVLLEVLLYTRHLFERLLRIDRVQKLPATHTVPFVQLDMRRDIEFFSGRGFSVLVDLVGVIENAMFKKE